MDREEGMERETIAFEVKDRVGLVTMSRPKQLNAMSSRFFAEMMELLDEVEASRDVGALVLTAQGKAFCAGADVEEVKNMTTPGEMTVFTNKTHGLWVRMEAFDKPILAAINGIAFGGGLELALACDLRMASSQAKFGLPEVKLGLMPGAGGTTRLPRIVGQGKALELLMLGDSFSAEEARALGIINWVVEPDQLEAEALRIAGILARERPPLAIAAIKRVTRAAAMTDMRSALAIELQAAVFLSGTADKREGMAALAEKRPPVFKGI